MGIKDTLFTTPEEFDDIYAAIDVYEEEQSKHKDKSVTFKPIMDEMEKVFPFININKHVAYHTFEKCFFIGDVEKARRLMKVISHGSNLRTPKGILRKLRG